MGMGDNMKLTPKMRLALIDARSNNGFRLVHDDSPGKPHPPHPWPTIHALERHELVDYADLRDAEGARYEKWTINDAGRLALDPPVTIRRAGHNSMRAKGSATSRVCIGGVWKNQRFPEPEKVTQIKRDENAERQEKRERHEADVDARRKDRERLSAEARLVEARRRAKMRQINVSHETHIVEKMLDRARRGGRPVSPSVVEKITRLEARLDYRPDLAA